MVEQIRYKGIDEGLALVRGLILKKLPSGIVLITISGGSCSGKSYFTKLLTEMLGKDCIKVARLALDDYFKNGNDPAMPRNEEGRKLFDSPESFHHNECLNSLICLLDGNRVYSPKYHFASTRRVCGHVVHPAPVVLVEGLFALRFFGSLRSGQINIFMEAPVETRESRRLERSEVYQTPKDELKEAFWAKVVPCHEQYVAPQEAAADIIISTGP